METFTRSILIGQVGCSRFNKIASTFKQLDNFRKLAKLTNKIKADIAVRNITGGSMLGKPVVDEASRWSFGLECLTVEGATMVIHNQTVTSFTINTLELLHAIRILRGLNKESKINGETLITLDITARVNLTGSRFTKLGMEANWALSSSPAMGTEGMPQGYL